jgi:NAD(P)-dependent dehydrogenase (short-subunit alcohol dehydrogenase family)
MQALRSEDEMRLANKVAIVVGAGQHPRRQVLGNGRAVAVAFAREGARVLLVDRDEESLEGTASMIKDVGGEASTHVANIGKEAECEGLVNACLERYGRIDVLHNNVAISVATGDGDHNVEELDVAQWDRTMHINLLSMALTCKYSLPHMRAQKTGSIINVSSGASLQAMPILAYSCSKAGVNTLTQHVAGLGANDGVRCNCLVLGNIREDAKRGTPWDVANAALFLASDEADFITGVLLPVDGGHSADLGMLASGGTLPRD